MPDAPPIPDLSASVSPTIDYDLTCSHCGYNLRTLRRVGLCPECGSPVADSLRSWLATRDPRWLRRMAWGTALLFPTPLLVLLVIAGNERAWQWYYFALTLIYSIGLCLVASRDPAASPASAGRRLRIITRLCAFALTVANFPVGTSRAWWSGNSTVWRPLIKIIAGDAGKLAGPIVLALLAISLTYAFLLLAATARQMRDRPLFLQSIRGLLLSVGPLIIMLALFLDKSHNDWSFEALALCVLATAWANIVFGRFVQVFRQAAQSAEKLKPQITQIPADSLS